MIATITIAKKNSGEITEKTDTDIKTMTNMIVNASRQNKNLKAAILFAAVAIIEKEAHKELGNKLLNVAMKFI